MQCSQGNRSIAVYVIKAKRDREKRGRGYGYIEAGQQLSNRITHMHMSRMEGSEYSGEGQGFGGSTSRKKRNKNKRRFSDEQIRSLESMFENETRLEPRKKVQLATDLGLHPRQVAIWFQNKRARYKSKQLERDCDVLRANYNNLASRFENLKKEKQALLVKLQKLNDVMNKTEGEGLGQCCRQDLEGNSTDANALDSEEKRSLSMERLDQGIGVAPEEDDSIKAEYFALEEEPNLVELVEPADSSLTSAEDWGSFDSDGLFDQSSTSYQWWDFWA